MEPHGNFFGPNTCYFNATFIIWGGCPPPCFPGYASGREVSKTVNLAFLNGWIAPLLVAHLLLKVSILQTERDSPKLRYAFFLDLKIYLGA